MEVEIKNEDIHEEIEDIKVKEENFKSPRETNPGTEWEKLLPCKTELNEYGETVTVTDGIIMKNDPNSSAQNVQIKMEPFDSDERVPDRDEQLDQRSCEGPNKQKLVLMDSYLSEQSFYSIRGAVSYAEENPIPDDVHHIDIIEIPPPVDALTDEEDIDDDILDDENRDPTFIPPEVPSTVELHQYDEERINDREQPMRKKRKTQDASWKKMLPSYSKFSTTANGANERKEIMKNNLKRKSPVEIFELFFSEDLLALICNQSTIYASQKNNHEFFLTTNCLRNFFAILLFSGYHRLPSERHYWNLDEDLDTSVIRKVMPRNRFTSIKRYLHFVNNEEAPNNKDDRSFKIRPLTDSLNEKFKQFGIFSKELSIDERIVRYYGRSSLKQFIRGKPIRFGFKQWVMCCGTSGYCFQMDLYQGKLKRSVQKDFCDSLGAKVVLAMIQHLQNPQDHEIYIDNFFTSYKMLMHMRCLGIRVTGNTRLNRTDKCPLSDEKVVKREEIGAFDYRFDEKEEILFVKWHDNSMVKIMGTNHQRINPLGTAKRWSSANRREISVPQPQLIAQYNKFVGGVDHLDWLIQKYHIGIRAKKWYFSLFTNCLDIAVINAWILHTMVSEEPLPLLDFKRSITRTYLQLQSADPKHSGRPKKCCSKVAPEVRFSALGHTLDRTEGGKQRKCAFCKKKVRKQCMKCDVGLHIGQCYAKWHSNECCKK